MKNKITKLFSIILACTYVICSFEYDALSKNNHSAKISTQLYNELSKISFDTKLQVAIAGYSVETANNEILINNDMLLSEKNINRDENDISIDEIQSYIQQKRKKTKETYINHNTSLVKELNLENDVFYISKFAPVFFANINKQQIMEISTSEKIKTIEYCKDNVEVKEYLNTSKNTVRAQTVQNNNMFRYTGNGVKIGILEHYQPNLNFSSLAGANITLHTTNSTYTEGNEGGHATTVTTILASQGTSDTAIGIAPDAEYYCVPVTFFENYNISVYAAYIMAIETLIDIYNVNIINISSGILFGGELLGMLLNSAIYNSYTTTANEEAYLITYLIDNYVNNSYVTFAIAAGNSGKKGIPFPFLSYNGIVVGNIDDNGTSSISDDSLNANSSYYNELTPTYASKPDLCAPGTIIDVNGTDKVYINDPINNINQYVESTGTSFSAPIVAGAAALMCEQQPILLTCPSAIKAIMTAGVFTSKHCYVPSERILTTDEESPASSYIQYGAGILNCVANGLILINETYDLGYFLPNFTQSNDQLELLGQKNVRISLAYALNTDDYNMTLDNFDIYLYDSTGTLIGSSTTSFNNVEIIDVYIPTSGTYTLKTVRTSSTNKTVLMGMAWLQYS